MNGHSSLKSVKQEQSSENRQQQDNNNISTQSNDPLSLLAEEDLFNENEIDWKVTLQLFYVLVYNKKSIKTFISYEKIRRNLVKILDWTSASLLYFNFLFLLLSIYGSLSFKS